MDANFRNCIFSPQSYYHFLFKSLWKNNLRPLRCCFFPFSGLSSGSCRPDFGGGLSAPVFSRKLLDCADGTCMHSGPSVTIGWAVVSSGAGAVLFTLKFLLGHSLNSKGLLFLFSLFRISGEVKDTYVRNFPWPASITANTLSGLLWLYEIAMSTQCKEVCVTQGDGRQVHIRWLCLLKGKKPHIFR